MDPIDRLGGFIPHPNKDPDPPATPAGVAHVEAEIGRPLPPEFAAFLLRHPEGPGILAEFLTCPIPDGRRLSVHMFYSHHIMRGGKSFLGYYYEESAKGGDLLPFARAGGGDHRLFEAPTYKEYCVGISGERTGKVYLAEPPEAGPCGEGSAWRNTILLATDFGAFLGSLRIEAPEFPRGERLSHLGDFRLSIWGRNSRPIHRDDIRHAEEEIGHTLPGAYVEFLLSHPFGQISFAGGSVFTLAGGGNFPVFGFYNVTPAEKNTRNGLAEIYEKEQEFLPSRYLPIGDNGLGDLVCIDLINGAVIAWNHELYDYYNNQLTAETIEAVAPSFEEFLRLLRPNSG